jgi:hypothetical protein
VTVYLLVSLGLLIALKVLDDERYLRALNSSHTGGGIELGGIWILGIWIWIFLVAIPIVVGSIKLLRNNHSGVFFSLVSLGLAVSLPLAMAVYFQAENEWSSFVLLIVPFAITVAMFPLLIVGSRRMIWK